MDVVGEFGSEFATTCFKKCAFEEMCFFPTHKLGTTYKEVWNLQSLNI